MGGDINSASAGMDTHRVPAATSRAERRARAVRDIRAVLYLQRFNQAEYEELISAFGLNDMAARVDAAAQAEAEAA